MIMEEVKDKHTYFLFIRDKKGNILDFVGPLFDDEVEQCRVEYFENSKAVESLEEQTFKILYSDDYNTDFNNNWADYLACHLDKLNLEFDIISISLSEGEEDVIEEESENDEESEFETGDELIVVYDVCAIKREEENICIQFNFEANPVKVAELILTLYKYCEGVLEVVILPNTQEEVDKFHNEKLKDVYLN